MLPLLRLLQHLLSHSIVNDRISSAIVGHNGGGMIRFAVRLAMLNVVDPQGTPKCAHTHTQARWQSV